MYRRHKEIVSYRATIKNFTEIKIKYFENVLQTIVNEHRDYAKELGKRKSHTLASPPIVLYKSGPEHGTHEQEVYHKYRDCTPSSSPSWNEVIRSNVKG